MEDGDARRKFEKILHAYSVRKHA